jgi:hypothetical protein
MNFCAILSTGRERESKIILEKIGKEALLPKSP